MESPTMQHECGCVNMMDEPTGAIKSILKCEHHKAMQRPVQELDESYYRDLGALDADAQERYRAEFVDGFGQLPEADGIADVLEIGGGFSPYIPMFNSKGYRYFGIEPSTAAYRWTMETHRNEVHEMVAASWDKPLPSSCHPFDIIFCAHALEHMMDASAAVQKMADNLQPGGILYILVPDDSDLTNPDHIWFFNQESLSRIVSLAGLEVESMVVRQRVPHEKFIYCKARKPEIVW